MAGQTRSSGSRNHRIALTHLHASRFFHSTSNNTKTATAYFFLYLVSSILITATLLANSTLSQSHTLTAAIAEALL